MGQNQRRPADGAPDHRCARRIARVVTRLALEIHWPKALRLQHLAPQAVTGRVAQIVVALNGVKLRHSVHECRVVHHSAAGCPRAPRDHGAKNAMSHYPPGLHGARTLDRTVSLVKQP
jgi:hypothetical protein